ncbi:MAG: class I SAM-dependent methyltransferase [Anaerolineae bacterium]|nr:class I SAM-dependent methyltransferase [Anaerolineae bacterium]MDW7992860.1 class I SAM-dependent methyltransferase [Anaerolineae bacterium]
MSSVFDALASGYDLGLWPLEVAVLRRMRRRAFPKVEGQVLEVGVGTGVNLPLYPPTATVVALDASAPMLRRALRRPARARVRAVQADLHRLPFRDGAFDAVTGSLVFCSVADPQRGLGEVFRVLRPGGRLVLLEHTRGRGLGAWLTDRLHPLWLAWNGVCHLNRETNRTVREVGFRLQREESHILGIFRLLEGVR